MNHTSSNPEYLIRLARNDSQLGPMLDLYRGYLKVLARLQIGRRLQGKVDASDIVQETFLQVHRTFSQFQGTTEQELLSWLRRVLAHVLANTVRQFYGTQRRDIRLEQQMDEQLDKSSQALNRAFVDVGTSPSEQAARREQAVVLANALERLPVDYREVIMLRHLEELSFPDIASHMNRSLGSVKKLWARALAQLRHLSEGTI